MHDCLCDGAIDVTTSLPAGDLHDRPRSVWRTELTKGHKIPKNNLSDDGIKAEQQINDDGRSLPHRGSEGPLRFRPARWMARRCAPYNETGAAWCQPSLLRCIKCLRCKGFCMVRAGCLRYSIAYGPKLGPHRARTRQQWSSIIAGPRIGLVSNASACHQQFDEAAYLAGPP
jgi:hypothetical protein